MNKQNMFQTDIVIPDIVQAKARETLANLPEYPVVVKSSGNEKGKSKKKLNRAVAFAAVAVAAAAVILLFGMKNRFGFPKGNTNLFTITVNAQEMEEGKPLQLTYPEDLLGESGYSSYPYFFQFTFNFDVLGDDVQSVDCSFFNSFCWVEHTGIKSDLFKGNEIKPYYDDFVVVPADNPRRYPEVRFYDGYTITYPFADKKDFRFDLIKEIIDRPDLEKMYKDLQPEVISEEVMPDGSIQVQYAPADHTEDYVAYFDSILKDVVVTITVHFSDGASETRYIGFKGMIIEEPFILADGTKTVTTYEGIECFFLTDSEVKNIDFEHPVIRYEKAH